MSGLGDQTCLLCMEPLSFWGNAIEYGHRCPEEAILTLEKGAEVA